MQIVALYRFPVKSMQGEALEVAEIGRTGIAGDRSHALRDDATGIVLTGRRDPAVLFARGVMNGEGAMVHLPDGTVTADAGVLSSWIGRPVSLVGPAGEPSTYEIAVDPEDDDSEVVTWRGPADSYHDSTRTQVSLIATGDMGDWDPRRFRMNIVVDAETVDGLVGHRVRVGTAELDIVKQVDRCVMVTRPQPGGIGRDLDVLRTIRRDRGLMLGVGGGVRAPGAATLGDRVEIVDT